MRLADHQPCVAAKGKPPKLVEAKKEVDPTEAPIITLKFQVSQRKVRHPSTELQMEILSASLTRQRHTRI